MRPRVIVVGAVHAATGVDRLDDDLAGHQGNKRRIDAYLASGGRGGERERHRDRAESRFVVHPGLLVGLQPARGDPDAG